MINAAGQDNHYTDPLTNMRVTAQGYARLTELLSPDIVVLEGGYSIEGALPYVNAGLLLALAGLDYSAALEPDWSEEKLKQLPHISEYIRKMVDQLWQLWRTRKDVDLEKIFGRGPFYTRRRQIYYDTDNIMEEQVEKIKLCSACSGWRVIHSGAARGMGGGLGRATVIAAVLLPWHVCEDCRRERAEFKGPKSGRFRYVYLQDVERIYMSAYRSSWQTYVILNNSLQGVGRFMAYDFDVLIERRGTNCVKWDGLEQKYGDRTCFLLGGRYGFCRGGTDSKGSGADSASCLRLQQCSGFCV